MQIMLGKSEKVLKLSGLSRRFNLYRGPLVGDSLKSRQNPNRDMLRCMIWALTFNLDTGVCSQDCRLGERSGLNRWPWNSLYPPCYYSYQNETCTSSILRQVDG